MAFIREASAYISCSAIVRGPHTFIDNKLWSNTIKRANFQTWWIQKDEEIFQLLFEYQSTFSFPNCLSNNAPTPIRLHSFQMTLAWSEEEERVLLEHIKWSENVDH